MGNLNVRLIKAIQNGNLKRLNEYINNVSPLIIIDWSAPLKISQLEKKKVLNFEEETLLGKHDSIYLISGKNNDGDCVYYIGKADDCSVQERLESHKNNNDIQGMVLPYDTIRVGEIKYGDIKKSANSLDQIESMLIFAMTYIKEKEFCNIQKKDSYTQYVDIPVIINNGERGPLSNRIGDPAKENYATSEQTGKSVIIKKKEE